MCTSTHTNTHWGREIVKAFYIHIPIIWEKKNLQNQRLNQMYWANSRPTIVQPISAFVKEDNNNNNNNNNTSKHIKSVWKPTIHHRSCRSCQAFCSPWGGSLPSAWRSCRSARAALALASSATLSEAANHRNPLHKTQTVPGLSTPYAWLS